MLLPRIYDPTIAIFGFPMKPLSTKLPLLRNQARLHFTPVRSNLGLRSTVKMTSEASEFVRDKRYQEITSGQERDAPWFSSVGISFFISTNTSLHPAAKYLLSHLIHLKGRAWSASIHLGLSIAMVPPNHPKVVRQGHRETTSLGSTTKSICCKVSVADTESRTRHIPA